MSHIIHEHSMLNLFLFKRLIHFNRRIITLQYCDGFCPASTWISHKCTCIPQSWNPLPHSSRPYPSDFSQSTGFLCPIPCFELAFVIYFTYGIYMFQCGSLKSCHPRLLPQSPKICSLHLCLFCCLAYSIVITAFLNFTYVH